MNWNKIKSQFFLECTLDVIPNSTTTNSNIVCKNPSFIFNWFKDKLSPKVRSNQQNRALHLYWELIAKQMNDQGYTEDLPIGNNKVEVPFTMESIKEYWRKCQIHLFNIKSTTKINTEQINKLIDVCSLHYGQDGIYVEFPSWQSYLNMIDEGAFDN